MSHANGVSWLLHDAEETLRLGATLGRHCPWAALRPLTLYLEGELGAGKTTIAQGLLHSLGVSGVVRSPSYSLMERYSLAQGLVVHVDLYRLNAVSEVVELGLRDDNRPGVLLLVEWPEKGAGSLSPPDLRLALIIQGVGREAQLRAASGAGELWLAGVAAEFSSQI